MISKLTSTYVILLFVSLTVFAKQPPLISKDNITDNTKKDVINYLRDYQRQLNSDSLAQLLDEKERLMNDIKGLATTMEQASLKCDSSQHTSPIDIRMNIPHLDSVLTQAIYYLKKNRGTDYLTLMEDNWDNFTVYGPIIRTIDNLNLLTMAYVPFYWTKYITIEKDTDAFYNTWLQKSEVIHFSARTTSLMHHPPFPFASYVFTTEMRVYALSQLKRYTDALEWGNTYLQDLLNWNYFDAQQLNAINAVDSHIHILHLMKDCYLATGDSAQANSMQRIISLYLDQ